MKSAWFAAAALGAVFMMQSAQAADINVFLTGAARRAYDTLAPQFEKATGHKLITQSALPPDLIKKVEAGEPFDVIILSYDVERLIKQGKLAAGSRTRVRPDRRRRRRAEGRAEAGLQHGRCVQAVAAQRQIHRNVG